MPGNVNHNKEIDSEDAQLILSAASRNYRLTAGEKVAADVDGDGEITAQDARLVLRKVQRLYALPIEGDIDGDGELSSADAKLVQNFSARLVKLTEAQKFMADINRDGVVNSKDNRIILRRAIGLE